VGGGMWCDHPRWRSECFQRKVSDLLRSTNCILSQIKGNSVNNCDFLKFIISVRGGHFDFSPGSPETLTAARIISPKYVEQFFSQA
jgi:hypothetical protein